MVYANAQTLNYPEKSDSCPVDAMPFEPPSNHKSLFYQTFLDDLKELENMGAMIEQGLNETLSVDEMLKSEVMSVDEMLKSEVMSVDEMLASWNRCKPLIIKPFFIS